MQLLILLIFSEELPCCLDDDDEVDSNNKECVNNSNCDVANVITLHDGNFGNGECLFSDGSCSCASILINI